MKDPDKPAVVDAPTDQIDGPEPGQGNVVRGVPESLDEAQRYIKWRDYLDPVAALGRLDTFAKWFFQTVSVVGLVAAGMSITGLSQPSPLAKILFAGVVLMVGLTLAFAALSLLPHTAHLNEYKKPDLLRVLDGSVYSRANWLQAASLVFALAFVAAGLAHSVALQSAMAQQKAQSTAAHSTAEAVTYSLADSGVFTATYVARWLPRRTLVDLELQVSPGHGVVRNAVAVATTPGDAASPNTSKQAEGKAQRAASARVTDTLLLPRASAASVPMARGDSLFDSITVTLTMQKAARYSGQTVNIVRSFRAASSDTQPSSRANTVRAAQVLLGVPIR